MHIIDIRLRHPIQLFESLDPSPFRDKALDRDAEAYLIDCAGELPTREPFSVRVHGPPTLATHIDDMAAGLHRHFELALQQAQRRHRRRARIARVAVLFGVVVLGVALLLREIIAGWSGIGELLSEGLLILAWVALWRPTEMVIFEIWERREELRLLRQLGNVPVQFLADSTLMQADEAGTSRPEFAPPGLS